MTEKYDITGNVENIIYVNDDDTYSVFEVCIEDGRDAVFVGNVPMVSVGETIHASGNWSSNADYGEQFVIKTFSKELPTDTEYMIEYLACGNLNSVGRKTAERIVSRFGKDAFDVILNNPSYLTDIHGITLKRASGIHSQLVERTTAAELFKFCSDYLNTETINSVYSSWGDKTLERIKEDPYSLLKEFDTIGFPRVDKMAMNLGIPKNSLLRVKACIVYVIGRICSVEGHCYVFRKNLFGIAEKLLELPEDHIESGLQSLVKDGTIISGSIANKDILYLDTYYNAELYCAEKLISVNKGCPSLDYSDHLPLIEQAQNSAGLKFNTMQCNAISACLNNGITIITGGPGTGKTTIIKGLMNIFDYLGYSTVLTAPTGRAAKRMSDATDYEAMTIHRLLDYKPTLNNQFTFLRNEYDPLKNDVIIVDETSMLDILLMQALLKAAKKNSRIVFIGDSDQLSSVGPGNVLKDMIDSERFETIRLDEIFRQSEMSLIVSNAHKIIKGEYPETNNKTNDFFFLERPENLISKTISDLCLERLPKAYGEDIINGIQIIAPSKKGQCGTLELNKIIHNAMNPQSADKPELRYHTHIFRVGDKVMQFRNNYDLDWKKIGCQGTGIFNGESGYITEVDIAEKSIVVDFDGKITEYPSKFFSDLDFSYAITVHKSQGSEFPAVIMPIYQCNSMLMTRNLLYTAVTRASKLLIMVGSRYILDKMVDNNYRSIRYTTLDKRLREI